ncbi:MAG: hypothetical protein EXS59_02425, partial [Candidatus Taylorbacteria bacterium]|nr:hypothetical protein [Candidatus Taylorbacteria bacterium]
MKKILVSLIMALVALLSVTTTQAFVPESGLKILNATDFSEVPQGDRVVIAKFLVKTDSSRVLTDSWQVGLKVSGGDANDLGTVFWTTTTGETVAYSETFKRMGDQR